MNGSRRVLYMYPQTCVGVACPGNRTCYDAWNAHECVCPDGFAGLMCELNLDECLSAPCRNGASSRALERHCASGARLGLDVRGGVVGRGKAQVVH